MLTPEEIRFITEYSGADTARLLLGASRYPGIRVPLCVTCIEARKKLASKAPQWYNHPDLVYPLPLSVEQCSSQATALYKQQLLKKTAGTSIQQPGADLTGGMGVDSYYLSQIVPVLDYYERNLELCRAAAWNFSRLGAENIRISNIEIAPEPLRSITKEAYAFIFMDPARRNKRDKTVKVISLLDYEPNLVELKETLFSITSTLLVKVSPIADISFHIKLLPETTQVHVVSVDNECKEVLFLLQKRSSASIFSPAGPSISAVHIHTRQPGPCREHSLESNVHAAFAHAFSFTPAEEANATVRYASSIGRYLYEPDKSMLKCGAFKLISARYGVDKLAPSTHLYTSDALLPHFPGKIYPIEEVVDFNKQNLKSLVRKYPQADVSARNFPLDTNAFKKRSGIQDGGNRHIFAVTLAGGEKKILITQKGNI